MSTWTEYYDSFEIWSEWADRHGYQVETIDNRTIAFSLGFERGEFSHDAGYGFFEH